jgi:hypothetical protein
MRLKPIDMDALLAVFSDWPHLMLLGGATLGGVLVGVGILKESETWNTAVILVLIGVIIEPIFTLWLFGYDENISRAQEAKIGRQNEEIIALIRNGAPRSIDISAFSKRLVSAPPARAEIRYVVACADCESLSFWLSDALKKANWSVAPAIPIAPQDRDWVRAVYSLHAQSSGITVVFDSPDKTTADPKSSIGALMGALVNTLGFNFFGYDTNTRGGVDYTMPPDLIRIVIAPKA